jgi:hypothetical protein
LMITFLSLSLQRREYCLAKYPLVHF